MKLNEEDIVELKKIIKYGYDEERRHFEEGDNRTPHIYTSFEHFNKKLELGLEEYWGGDVEYETNE